MSELMTPIPFRELMTWITTEYQRDGSVFGVHKPYKAGVKKLPIFGETIETPFGPAAGPNTQLAQNIIAGYFGGAVDNIIMRLVDIFYCLPSMPILIILGAMMDAQRFSTYARLFVMMASLGIMGWAGIARLVRGQILSLREQDFMIAAEATGVRVSRRIFRHLVPNVMPQLIVTATSGLGGIIITESTLSFLGLGVKHPLATWGTMINSVSSQAALEHYYYIWIPVGLLICLTVIAFNFVGDGLRDAFDPKSKE